MARHEQVRPRLVDLAEVDDDGQDALMQWPAAASVVRKPPPQVEKKEAKQVRFDGAGAHETADASMPEDAPPVEKPYVPVMGAIHERADDSTGYERRTAPRTSRFRAEREMDRALDDGLDENGKPMSAFRRSRLLKSKGQSAASPGSSTRREIVRETAAPPAQHDSAAPAAPAAAPPSSSAPFVPDPTRDPGGGAPPDQVTSLLDSVAAENAEKVRHMSYTNVEEELQDAMAFFGADALAKLKARRGIQETDEGGMSEPAAPAAPAAQGWPALERRLADVDLESSQKPSPAPQNASAEELEAFRAKYFPDEPETVNPSLAWTVSEDTAPSAPQVRFDFGGKVSWRPGAAPSTDHTYLAGLHHHGAEQHAPGYTIDELLHLVQSSVAAQRTMALQVLGRILSLHPQRLANGLAGATFGTRADPLVNAALDADGSTPRANILLSARWLLNDRHRSVRTAAMTCLASALASISVFAPSDAVRLGALPVSAPPRLDWLWLSALQPEGAWTPREAPGAYAETDASYIELVRRDWASTLLQTDLLATLDSLAAAHGALDDAAIGTHQAADIVETRAALLDILFYLVVHSTEAAQRLAQHPHAVRLIAQLGGTARAWPLGDVTTWPSAHALALILRSVQSSKHTAEELMGQGVLGGVLRYLVLPPIGTSEGPVQVQEQILLFLAVRIVTCLARYGLCSTSVRETWPALQRLGDWAATSEERAAPAVLEMLAVWTHLARQGPRHGDLGVNWPAVREWVRWSIACLAQPTAAAKTAAIEHIASWAYAARELEPELLEMDGKERVVQQVQTLLHNTRAALPVALAALEHSRTHRDAAGAAKAILELVPMAKLAGAIAQLMQATPWAWTDKELCAEVQHTILASPLIDVLSMPIVGVDGTSEAAQVVVLAACMESVGSTGAAEDAATQDENEEKASDVSAAPMPPDTSDTFVSDAPPSQSASPAVPSLLALVALPPEEGTLAHRLLATLVQRWDARLWTVLAPFLEDLLQRAGTPPAMPYSLVKTLQLAAPMPPSLGITPLPAGLPESDSVTGATLWQAPSSGLPLRHDWPFAPLDDLLHSGEARVFNRADGLPADWDFSEADIVAASLQLAVRVVHASLGAALPSLMQAAHVWLGVTKVFLLEQNQAHSEKYSGAATGRDLYATEPVRRLLQTLMHLADCAAAQSPTVSLEDAADALRTGVSFYQLYTDLVGLYDAVSLGDPVFARVLLPPLAMTYAVDYRRLLWSDYAHLLRTITTRVEDAPVSTGGAPPASGGATPGVGAPLCIPVERRVTGYLHPLETDRIVLGCYAQALRSGQVTPEQPLLYRIALHHTAHALFGTGSYPDRDALGRLLYSSEAPAAVQGDLVRYLGASDADVARWVST